MSAFSDAITSGLDAVSTSAGEEVTYVQAASVITLTAVQGRTSWDSDKPQPGLKLTERTASWLIPAAQLRLGSRLITPRPGDTLTTSDGRTFRALPRGPAEPVHSPVDRAGRSWWRVNMKERSA